MGASEDTWTSQSVPSCKSFWYVQKRHLLIFTPVKELFAPLVQRLGYDFLENDPVEVRQLRMIAIKQAASAKDER